MEGERVATSHFVEEDDISKLLRHFVKTSHRVKNADIKGETIMERCCLLFAKDYKFTVVPNLNGELCGHYPMKLIITEFERDAQSCDENVESRYNPQHLMQMMKNARCARCRSRFVVPVIFYQGKHICRSATLSGAAEMFGRSTTDYLLSNQNASVQDVGKTDMFDKFRGHDIQLLKFLEVGYICDLMVEKKKTKFGMPVSSSEKVDKENRYSDFTILGMPYPGCEFFKDWKDNLYIGETTMYDWGQSLNDSSLDLPPSSFLDDLNINWSRYTEWNLVELTQNYMKLLVQYIRKGTSGILIHCISGWDRTPLFISLLRLSLWADMAIHRSLSANEILYLTLGYDWYLFGHDLPDRINNEQEVLYFCFKVLRDIAGDEYSVFPRAQQSQTTSSTSTLSQDSTSTQRQQSMTSTTATVHPRPQTTRVDSDSSLSMPGVLLAEDLMSFPNKGSNSSLNSIASSDTPEPKFAIGPSESELEEALDAASTDFSAELSMSSATGLRHSSPVSTRQRHSSSDSQQLFIKSNHFVNIPSVPASSPMSVPQHSGDVGSSASVGSWQIIPSGDNMRVLSTGSSNSHSSADRLSHISSCYEATDINMSSMRWQRLDAISRLFQTAYASSVPFHNARHSSGSGLSSLLDRFAEQVGLRVARPKGASGYSGTGV